MLRRLAVRLFLTLLSTHCVAGGMDSTDAVRRDAPEKILFVGNSLIYTNNVPSLFDALSRSRLPNERTSVDMYAAGGASITSWSKNAILKANIFETRYQKIVLQERGGDTLCVLDEVDRSTPACSELIAAHLEFAKWAEETGARIYYLGTYQSVTHVSPSLVDGKMD